MADKDHSMATEQMPAGRIRKAWRVTAEWWDGHYAVYFAHTAGQARMACWRNLDRPRESITKITARRWKEKDEILPARSPIADNLSERDIHCLRHAFGVSEYEPWKAGYRDYFYTSASDEIMLKLVEIGLMYSQGAPLKGSKGMIYFRLTGLGKQVAMSLTPLYSVR